MAAVTSEPLWLAKDVAAYIHCSPSSVYAYAESGELPSVKLFGLRRFVPAEIRAYVMARSRGN
jgi:hypothetical protein